MLDVSACAMPSLMPPCIWASRPRGLIGSPASIAKVTRVTRGPVTRVGDLALDGLGPAVDLDEAGAGALVLLVDGDALGRAGLHRLAPLAGLGDRVQHAEHPRVAEVLLAELVGVQPHLCGELVDHQLPRRAHVGRVDVAHAAGVEPLVDLVEQLRLEREVVGQDRGQREDALGERRGCPARRAGRRPLRSASRPGRAGSRSRRWCGSSGRRAAGRRRTSPARGWSPSGASAPRGRRRRGATSA